MASLASHDDSVKKVIFLRSPPPPFDCGFVRSGRGSDDTDEDWLPNLRDIFNGNFHEMIDLTRDSESESDVESSTWHPRSGSGTVLTTTPPTGLLPSYNKRSPRICQPSTADSHEWEQAEIPESPSAAQVSPTAGILSSRHSEGDTVVDGGVDGQREQSQQEQYKEEQEWEEGSSGGGGLPPSRQRDAPSPASTTELLESGMVTELQSQETVQDDYLRTQSASRIASPAREVPCTNSEPSIGIQDITFLYVAGQLETARGPEYLFVGEMWLRPGVGVPSDLPEIYRREVARESRLETLRTRKRRGEEVEAVQAKRRKTVK